MRRTVKIKLSCDNKDAIERTASQLRDPYQYAVEAGWRDDDLESMFKEETARDGL